MNNTFDNPVQSYVPVFLGKLLQEEGGITRVSLENLNVLKRKLGNPQKVIFKKFEDEFFVKFDFESHSYVATGFSWGYSGQGPRELVEFLATCSTVPTQWWSDFISKLPDYDGFYLSMNVESPPEIPKKESNVFQRV